MLSLKKLSISLVPTGISVSIVIGHLHFTSLKKNKLHLILEKNYVESLSEVQDAG